MKFSAAPLPPRELRRTMACSRHSSASCEISDGVGSSRRRSPQDRSRRVQYGRYALRVLAETDLETRGMYDENVGTSSAIEGPTTRSAGSIPSPDSNSRAASRSAELANLTTAVNWSVVSAHHGVQSRLGVDDQHSVQDRGREQDPITVTDAVNRSSSRWNHHKPLAPKLRFRRGCPVEGLVRQRKQLDQAVFLASSPKPSPGLWT